MANPVLVQSSFGYAVDPDNTTDPDLAPGDWTIDSAQVDLSVDDAVHVRIQVRETAGNDSGNNPWQFYYDSDNTPATATQCTTVDANVQVTDDGGSNNIPNGATVDTLRCDSQSETWQDGEYIDTADEGAKHSLAGNYYTEFQFHLKFFAVRTYYIFLRYNDDPLSTYTQAVKFVVTSGTLSLAGTCDGVSSVSGAMAEGDSIVGSLDGSSAVSGDLAEGLSIAGTIDAQSAISGTIAQSWSLAGTVDGQSSMSGAVAETGTLTGSTDGQANISGDLTEDDTLTGSLDGQSSLSASLSEGGEEYSLAGTVDGQSNVSGDISEDDSIVGTLDATSGISALLAEGLSLIGTLDGQSAISGAIEKSWSLAGSVSGQSAISSADLAENSSLIGTIDAVSTMVAALATSESAVYPATIVAEIDNPQSGQAIMYDGTKWINAFP